MPAAYAVGMMLDVGNAAASAAVAAQAALTRSAPAANERTMGAMAQQALFAEALLGAVKARVAELKLVAK